MLRTTFTASHPETVSLATPTAARSRAPSVRHVMAGPTGRGGITVAATPLESVADTAHGPGLLALADLLVDDMTELPLASSVLAWREGGSVWVRLPARGLRVVVEERQDVAELAALPPAADPGTERLVWAVVDRRIGEVAARGFGSDGREDDAVGFRGAMALTHRLGRPLLVTLATGSVVTTRPAPRGQVEIGGAVMP